MLERVALEGLARAAREVGDGTLSRLLTSLRKDGIWHEAIASSLCRSIATAHQDNATRIAGYLDQWRAKTMCAAGRLLGAVDTPEAPFPASEHGRFNKDYPAFLSQLTSDITLHGFG